MERGGTSPRSYHPFGGFFSPIKLQMKGVEMSSLRFFVALAIAVATSTLGTYVMAHAAQGNVKGAAGQSPAFYDDQLFTINLFELSDTAAASILAKNVSVNEIYASNDLDEEQDFVPVIDAVPTDAFNPLWHQFLIVFNSGFAPHQFTSDDDIDAAVDAGEITLVDTGEVYRCSVVHSGISLR
jgi:hypothetical protein